MATRLREESKIDNGFSIVRSYHLHFVSKSRGQCQGEGGVELERGG
jgi:hypothetical protein